MESTDTPAPKPPAPAPMMDVRPPHGQVAVKPAPPAEDTDPDDEAPNIEAHKDPPKNKAKKPAATKKPENGVGMAIFATVVIVLGLAALATYAYIKTQN